MSQVPVFVLLGLAVAAALMLAIAIWLGVRLRASRDPVLRAVQATMVGVAVWAALLCGAGNRHYGGDVTGLDDSSGTAFSCGVWYEEAGLPASAPAGPGDHSGSCRDDAIAAIGPAVGWTALLGAGAGLVVFGAGWAWRRRRRRTPTTRFVE